MLKARLLALDIATVHTGWMVVDVTPDGETCIVEGGTITGTATLAQRKAKANLHFIRSYDLACQIDKLISQHSPTDVVVENMFVGTFSKRTVLSLGEGRGVQLYPVYARGLGHTLKFIQVKEARADLGYGSYDKEQVQQVLAMLFPEHAITTWDDNQSDALLIAYYFAQRPEMLHFKQWTTFSLKREGGYGWIAQLMHQDNLSPYDAIERALNLQVADSALNPFEYVGIIEQEKAHALEFLGDPSQSVRFDV